MDNNTVPAEVKGVGYTEKLLKPMSGYLMLALNLLLTAGSVVMIATGGVFDITPVFVIGFLLIPVWLFLLYGYCVIAPNEAVVLTLFGKYRKATIGTAPSAASSTPPQPRWDRAESTSPSKP